MPRIRVKGKVRIPKKNPAFALINVFKQSVVASPKNKLREIAFAIAAEVREALRQQTLNLEPLSPAYLQYKKSHGLDERTLIATGDYLAGIGVRELADGTVEVGVKDRIHKPSGLTLAQIARIHEFGSAKAGIPARPHWRPVMARFRNKIAQTKRDLLREAAKPLKEFLKKNKGRKRLW